MSSISTNSRYDSNGKIITKHPQIAQIGVISTENAPLHRFGIGSVEKTLILDGNNAEKRLCKDKMQLLVFLVNTTAS